MASVTLATDKITDTHSFHEQCISAFGFPNFYGRNMDAWTDCLSSLREDEGMSRFKLAREEQLFVTLVDFETFANRLPEISNALLVCIAAVNCRYVARNEMPGLALILQ